MYGIPEPEEEEEKMDIPLNDAQKKALKRGKKIEYEPEQIAEYKARKALEKEMATYGVSILLVFCLFFLLFNSALGSGSSFMTAIMLKFRKDGRQVPKC